MFSKNYVVIKFWGVKSITIRTVRPGLEKSLPLKEGDLLYFGLPLSCINSKFLLAFFFCAIGPRAWPFSFQARAYALPWWRVWGVYYAERLKRQLLGQLSGCSRGDGPLGCGLNSGVWENGAVYGLVADPH